MYGFDFHHDCVNELRESFRSPIIQLADETDDGLERISIEKQAIARFDGLSVHVYADEHPPPHFHVRWNGEERSFSIDTCSPLHASGGLARYLKNIKKWHKKNQRLLVEAWNANRPADCPVGPIIPT
jgi:Domain of unknown function (DUF4160)